jgi:putative ABC transport system permease protein
MILLRLISWPYFRKHVLRTALTTAGIVLGVAVFVGIHTANSSVMFAFSRTVDRIAGKTELQVTAGEPGFPEEVLEKVQAASTVRVAVPVIEAVVETNFKGQGNLLVLGVDMTGDRTLRDYDLDSGDDAVIEDPLVFLAQPDSIILSNEFADRNHHRQRPDHAGHDPRRPGVHRPRHPKSSGLSSAFGGNSRSWTSPRRRCSGAAAVRPDRHRRQGRRDDCAGPGGAARSGWSGISNRSAVRTGPAVRGDDRRFR